MFVSSSLFAGNLCDPSKLASSLSKIAKIDRLPADNSLAALKALNYAWSTVDVCNRVATEMKSVTKSVYITLLFLGLLVGVLTVVHLNDIRTISMVVLKNSVASVSLISGIIAGLASTISPSQKWTRLRGAALAIEAETWRFRTRTGVYAEDAQTDNPNSGSDDAAEQVLRNRAEAIKHQVLKASGVMNTYFMSYFELFDNPRYLKMFKHGQFEGSAVSGSFGSSRTAVSKSAIATVSSAAHLDPFSDDFHSPCRPSDYITLRVEPQLRFYQGRLPGYDRSKTSSKSIIVFGTFTGVALALFEVVTWAAIATAVVAAFTAWTEFNGAEDKLTRYSDAISQVESVKHALLL